MNGKLITIEGISGIGKTYLLNELKEQYRENESIIFHKEIMDEEHKEINKKIFEILFATKNQFFDTGNPKMETLLIIAKRANNDENVIRPVIETGKIVISDRGIDTICVYQSIMLYRKYGGDLHDYVKCIHNILSRFCLVPNKTILLTGDYKSAINRAEERNKLKYTDEEIEILKLAAELYQYIAKTYQNRFIIIDIDKEELSDDLLNHVINDINSII